MMYNRKLQKNRKLNFCFAVTSENNSQNFYVRMSAFIPCKLKLCFLKYSSADKNLIIMLN